MIEDLICDENDLFQARISAIYGSEFDNKKPTIYFAIDENYAPYCAVTLCSLLKNCRDYSFNIIIFSLGLTEKSIDIFRGICEQFNVGACHVVISQSVVAEFHESRYITKATYLSVLLPRIISSSIALFLDSDLLVLSDINELLAEAKGMKLVAACEANTDKRFHARLKLDVNTPYLNTGVILYNTNLWRDQSMSPKIRHTYRTLGYVEFQDQDLFNIVVEGQAKVLERKWNLRKMGADIIYTQQELEGNDGIIHFNGAIKPWMSSSTQAERNVYNKYANLIGLDKKYLCE